MSGLTSMRKPFKSLRED